MRERRGHARPDAQIAIVRYLIVRIGLPVAWSMTVRIRKGMPGFGIAAEPCCTVLVERLTVGFHTGASGAL